MLILFSSSRACCEICKSENTSVDSAEILGESGVRYIVVELEN